MQEIRFHTRCTSYTTLEHIKASLIIINQIGEFCLHQLTIVVRNQVFKRILETLLALALVTAWIVASSQDRNTLKFREVKVNTGCVK